MTNNIGIYVHIPFCAVKCPYCDFYSISYDKQTAAAYTAAVIRNIESYSGKFSANTLFFGGGTPSLLTDGICDIVRSAKDAFGLQNAEITIEVNPKTVNERLLKKWQDSGVNRISFGVQSLCDNELIALGRNHNAKDALAEIELAKKCGYKNISADLMLGTPYQTEESVIKSITGLANVGVTHISAYMLQIEEGTPFYNSPIISDCPDEDTTAKIYLTAVQKLGELGYNQYEISNFAKAGFESKHNLKYWNCEQYLGFGAAAHSFIGATRFAVENDSTKFISSPLQETYITDDNAGTAEEYEMLKLRLCCGICADEITARFGKAEFERIKCNAEKIEPKYISVTNERIALTPQGFLVSNDLIGKIIYD